MASELADIVATAHAGLTGDIDAEQARAQEQARERADVSATGEALDGRVRAVMSSSGRLSALTVDPQAMRVPLDELTAAVREAVNAAQARLAGRVDVAPVVNALRAVREQAQTELTTLMAGFGAAESNVRTLRRES